MNSYEERQEAKKARYREKAQQLRQQSEALCAESSNMAGAIPFGQPILVGHHSEKSDRSYRTRIGAKMDASIKAQDKADYYEQKAESVGKGGISSYDPEAAEKIKEKIERLKAGNEYAKEANKIWRKLYNKAAKETGADKIEKAQLKSSKEVEAAFFLAVEEFKKTHEEAAKEIVSLANCYAYPCYANLRPYGTSTVEIRRLEQRLKLLEHYAEKGTMEVEKNGYKCTQDPEEMRVMFEFDGKPSEEVRNILKRNGFKWSRYACAWVRKLTPSATHSARSVMSSLDQLASGGEVNA